jgi:hypothetical protein
MALPLITSPRFTQDGSSPRSEMLGPMSVTGSKFGVSQSPRLKQVKTARNSRDLISVQDYVKTVSGKPQFGNTFYNMPSNEMLLKRIPFGKPAKGKNISFTEQVMKKSAWVPGPKYDREIDWKKSLPI